MKAAPTAKQTFKTTLTSQALILSILPITCSIFLFVFAAGALDKLDPSDAARIPFAGIPLLLGIILISTVVALLKHFLNREIIIDGQYLLYRDSGAEIHLEIPRMAYSPPTGSGLLKLLMFSDGISFVQIPQIFLGEQAFLKLDEEIASRRRKSRGYAQETYSL